MSWKVRIDRRAIKELKIVPKPILQRFRLKTDVLAASPEQFKHFALKGEKLKGFFRLRIGNWRVFCTLDNENKEVVIWSIKHRSDAYKN